MKNIALLSVALVGVITSGHIMSMEQKKRNFLVTYTAAVKTYSGWGVERIAHPARFDIEECSVPQNTFNLEKLKKHLEDAMNVNQDAKIKCSFDDDDGKTYHATIAPVIRDDTKKLSVTIKQKS